MRSRGSRTLAQSPATATVIIRRMRVVVTATLVFLLLLLGWRSVVSSPELVETIPVRSHRRNRPLPRVTVDDDDDMSANRHPRSDIDERDLLATAKPHHVDPLLHFRDDMLLADETPLPTPEPPPPTPRDFEKEWMAQFQPRTRAPPLPPDRLTYQPLPRALRCLEGETRLWVPLPFVVDMIRHGIPWPSVRRKRMSSTTQQSRKRSASSEPKDNVTSVNLLPDETLPPLDVLNVNPHIPLEELVLSASGSRRQLYEAWREKLRIACNHRRLLKLSMQRFIRRIWITMQHAIRWQHGTVLQFGLSDSAERRAVELATHLRSQGFVGQFLVVEERITVKAHDHGLASLVKSHNVTIRTRDVETFLTEYWGDSNRDALRRVVNSGGGSSSAEIDGVRGTTANPSDQDRDVSLLVVDDLNVDATPHDDDAGKRHQHQDQHDAHADAVADGLEPHLAAHHDDDEDYPEGGCLYRVLNRLLQQGHLVQGSLVLVEELLGDARQRQMIALFSFMYETGVRLCVLAAELPKPTHPSDPPPPWEFGALGPGSRAVLLQVSFIPDQLEYVESLEMFMREEQSARLHNRGSAASRIYRNRIGRIYHTPVPTTFRGLPQEHFAQLHDERDVNHPPKNGAAANARVVIVRAGDVDAQAFQNQVLSP